MFKFFIEDFKDSFLQNAGMDLVDTLCDAICLKQCSLQTPPHLITDIEWKLYFREVAFISVNMVLSCIPSQENSQLVIPLSSDMLFLPKLVLTVCSLQNSCYQTHCTDVRNQRLTNVYVCIQSYIDIYVPVSLGVHNLGIFYARKLKFGMLFQGSS